MAKNRNINPKQKAKNFKKALLDLACYSKKYLVPIIISFVLALGSAVLACLGPNKIKEILNLIGEGIMMPMNLEKITSIASFLIIIYALSSIFNLFQDLLTAKAAQGISKNLRTDISQKINRVPIKFVDSSAHGDLLSRVTNDVDSISQGVSDSFATIVHSLAMLLLTTIMMFTTNVTLTITTIVTCLIGFALISIVVTNSQKYFVMQQNGLGKVNGHIEEVYTNQNIVNVYNATDEEAIKFNGLNSDLYKSAWKSQFLSGLMPPIMNFIGNLSYVSVCVIGSILAVKGKTDIGTIIAFIIYARMFTNPLTQFAQSVSRLQSSAAASERVFEFLKESEMSDESMLTNQLNPQKVKGDVEFKNVHFGYTSEKTIINDFSATVKAGQKVAIVGPTGAGKTTIVNLLMRFYEINSGDILIDGVSTKTITRENLHDLFGMVLQDSWLFEGTLRENLVFNKTGITDAELDNVCATCGLDHFIKTLPNGYDTQLSEATALSVGQKQLLTIARAMIQNSPMIILDEATSNIDTRTELIVQQAMDKLSSGRTSFVIAHRLSTIKNADMIIVMKNGDIVEQGNHSELLAKNGAYAELYNSQFAE